MSGKILTFIGMSGSGKTYWSSLLAGIGNEMHGLPNDIRPKRIGCDDLILASLGNQSSIRGDECSTTSLSSVIPKLSAWLGFPWEEGYNDKADHYLKTEATVLDNAITHAQLLQKTSTVIIDTTGSVIYLPPKLLEQLKSATEIIYLESSLEELENKVAKYLSAPTPLIWGEHFKPLAGETIQLTLSRCYVELVQYRDRLYRQLAHRVIPATTVADRSQPAIDFWNTINNISSP